MTAGLFAGASAAELWQPPLLLGAVAMQGAYLAAICGPLRPRSVPAPRPGNAACFLAGVWLLYLCFGGPLDYLADNVSVAAHMAQHTLEAFWAAPLLLVGLPEPWRRALRARPAAAAVAFNAAFLAFHLPGLYDWTLANPTPHLLEHALLLALALPLWAPVLGAGADAHLPSLRSKLTYLFANAYVMMPLAALLLMAGRPWYVSGAAAHGLNPLGDQQWGAIAMMLGMFFAYAGAALHLLVAAAAPAG